jgi:hypothetical protein
VAFVMHHWGAIAGLLVNAESKVGSGGGRGGAGGGGGGGGGDVELTAQEVDHLEFIFAPLGGAGAQSGGTEGGVKSGAPLFSTLTGLFTSPVQTVPAGAVRDWVVKNCAGIGGSSSAAAAAAAAAGGGGGGGLVVIENVHKGTAVRREGDVPAGASVRISGGDPVHVESS